MQAFSEFLYLGFAAEEYCRYIVRDEVEEDFFVALLRDRYRDLLFLAAGEVFADGVADSLGENQLGGWLVLGIILNYELFNRFGYVFAAAEDKLLFLGKAALPDRKQHEVNSAVALGIIDYVLVRDFFLLDMLAVGKMLQSRDLIAAEHGFLKLQIRRERLHFVFEGADYLLRVPLKDCGGFLYLRQILLFCDSVRAGGAAGLDMGTQAGAFGHLFA